MVDSGWETWKPKCSNGNVAKRCAKPSGTSVSYGRHGYGKRHLKAPCEAENIEKFAWLWNVWCFSWRLYIPKRDEQRRFLWIYLAIKSLMTTGFGGRQYLRFTSSMEVSDMSMLIGCGDTHVCHWQAHQWCYLDCWHLAKKYKKNMRTL